MLICCVSIYYEKGYKYILTVVLIMNMISYGFALFAYITRSVKIKTAVYYYKYFFLYIVKHCVGSFDVTGMRMYTVFGRNRTQINFL